MRIKRLATIGTSLLVMVCIGLYLLLDTTLTNEQKSVKRPKALLSRILHKPEDKLALNDSSKRRFIDINEDVSLVCSAPVSIPDVDVQMGHVYDTIPFDDIDGGVWKQGWNVVYDENQWSAYRKLQIFVVPHSHNDPGWKKTFEDYYTSQTRSILNNMVTKLLEDKRRKFIWAEISYFSLWWSEIPQSIKENVKLLLSRGQLEIVTGGWVMADEANSHYYAVIEQLLHGHQWLHNNLGYKPRYSWSIDPFGLSPTLPFLLREAGFKGLAVQRSHYSVKKYLAKNKQLEFRWRQLWDNDGWTELMTHMMPFYSYDVPHTCGPDPKICCQFDFKRLPGYGVSCPWRVPPQQITPKNVAQRAMMLLDQYKKKAQLYSTNVLLVPLGDDFRYDHSTEWDAQYLNYQKLFDYINSNPRLHAQAQFGTLSDYFSALQKEKEVSQFPTLSGDFFTYADREDHYWSGYYTSRPFYKRMDRVLISYLRSAEVLLTLLARFNSQLEILPKLNSNLTEARSSLSLFQHHDGITGTAKDHVVQDYAVKMIDAIYRAQHVMQQSAYYLVKSGELAPTGNETYLVVDEHQKSYSLAEGVVISFPTGVISQKVVVFNPLTYHRFEVISLRVENRFVQVRNSKGHLVDYQISPVCSSVNPGRQCFTLIFTGELPPLSLLTYTIEPANEDSETHASLKQYGSTFSDLYDDWKEKQLDSPKDFSLQNNNISVAFNKNGLLKAIIIKKPDNIVTVPINLSFVRYSTRQGKDKSGAYLFLPDGEAKEIKIENPNVMVIEGKIMSQVIVKFPNVEHSVVINHSEKDGYGIEIRNLINIASVKNNYEIAMRFSSNIIKNEGVFYTDLNGFQMIKRKTLSKIPLQGNFYPMPTAAYIEDKNTRLTLLSGQPLGVASLHEGQLEVMQDRRLLQDDNRGLDQPVMDNRPTLSVFKLIVETKTRNCEISDSVWGKLSGNAYPGLLELLYPVQKLIPAKEHVRVKDYIPPVSSLPHNIHLISSLVLPGGIGVLLHSSSVETCYSSIHNYKASDKLNLSHVMPTKTTDRIYKSTLTFNDMLKEISNSDISMCENDIDAYFIRDI